MPNPVIAAMGRKGAAASWANTPDRTARTAPGRTAFQQKFIEQAGGDLELAAELRSQYYRDLAAKTAHVRRARAAKAVTDGCA